MLDGSLSCGRALARAHGALAEPTYEDANAVTEERSDRSLTTQAWRLLPRIREADDLLRSAVRPGTALRESHPEVCFHHLATGNDTLGSKHADAKPRAGTGPSP